jgi:hypothetical protein
MPFDFSFRFLHGLHAFTTPWNRVNEQRFFYEAGSKTGKGRIGPVKGSTPCRCCSPSLMVRQKKVRRECSKAGWPSATSRPLKCAADRR